MPKHILVADDSLVIQKAVGITFAQQDFTLTFAGNGEEALLKAKEKTPDLAIVDIVMPKKNGYEVCEAFKKDALLRSIPVLLLSGTHEPFDEVKGKNVGAEGYILKPFESQVLIDRVQQLLAKTPTSNTLTMPRPISTPPLKQSTPNPVSHPSSPLTPHPSPASTIAMGKPIQPSAPPIPQPPQFNENSVLDLTVDEISPPQKPSPPSPPSPTSPLSHQEEVFDLSFDDSMIGSEPPIELESKDSKPSPDSQDSLPSGEFWDFSADAKDPPASPSKSFVENVLEQPTHAWEKPLPGTLDAAQSFSMEELSMPSSEEIPFETSSFDLISTAEALSPISISESEPLEIEKLPLEGTSFSKVKLDSTPTPSPSTSGLSEEQIEAIVTKVFKGVIERIAWEVVPDLAESIIKEELKRLTQEKP